MFGNSVISRTGQSWKLMFAIVLMLVGSFAPLWEGSGINWTEGTILAVVGYVFGTVLIVCPKCGKRWFWAAALDARLYGPLFRESACPACKHDFSKK
jgi:energy-coupling factor transporter transmembrane protein EcfT